MNTKCYDRTVVVFSGELGNGRPPGLKTRDAEGSNPSLATMDNEVIKVDTQEKLLEIFGDPNFKSRYIAELEARIEELGPMGNQLGFVRVEE